MSDIPNVELTDSPVWVPAQSTVNGQPDDQALDMACHQAAANRTAYLKSKLSAAFKGTKLLLPAIGQEKSGDSGKWRYQGAGYWKIDSTQSYDGNSLGLYFPIDLPIGSVITKAEVTICPPAGHSSLPAYQPKASFGGETVVVQDTTLNDYHTNHYLTLTPESQIVVTGPMELFVSAESGSNALAGTMVFNAKVTFTSPIG